MNNFKVLINSGYDQTFTTSYQHPLTKRRIRMNFLNNEDAITYKKKIEKKFKRSNFSNFKDLTIEELLIYFMQEVSKNPFILKKSHLIDFIESFGHFRIDEVTTKALKNWLDQIQIENKRKDSSQLQARGSLFGFFNFLKDKEIISESPLSTVYYKTKPKQVKSRNLLSPAEIDKLLEAIRDYSPGYLYPFIKMFAETAAKSSEIIELTWNQIDLEQGKVTFEKKQKSQARTVKVSEELVYMLRLKKDKKDRVFMTYYNEPFTYEKLRRVINEFKSKKLYNEQWVTADLRHSFAVNFLTGGGDIKELQNILGHWNVYETKRLYGDISKKQLTKDIVNHF